MNHREKVWTIVAEYLPPMNNEDLLAMVTDLTNLVNDTYARGYEDGQWMGDD